jgi:hypothetical protein
MVYFHVHKKPPLDSVFRQIQPTPIITFFFFISHCRRHRHQLWTIQSYWIVAVSCQRL